MSDIESPSQRQQLQMLREMTRLTGALHEAQVLQLKMWPLVLFQWVSPTGVEFTWSADQKVVAYTLAVMPGRKVNEKQLQERTAVLNGWLHELLGDEWRVEVTTKGKTAKATHGTRKVNAAPRLVVSRGKGKPAHRA